MKINELVTTLDDKNLTEAGFKVQSDTVAKLRQNYGKKGPDGKEQWTLGLPHPESGEPTATELELIKVGRVDPNNPKKVDPQTDPRYFGPDGEQRKAANKRAKDKFGDRAVTFSKSPTDYLTQGDWDFKYGETHNPDGSPKKIDTKNTSNNPKALKDKQYKKNLNSKDVKLLDKAVILFNMEGKFDSFSGIGSMQDVPVTTLQSNDKELGAIKNREMLEKYLVDQSHKLYGFVDSFRDKDIKLIDDKNIEGITYTGADPLPKNTSSKDLTPGQDTLPGSTGLSSDYQSKITEYYKKLHKFYKPYYELLMSDNPSFMDESRWLNIPNYNPNDDINDTIDIPRIPASIEMVTEIKKRLAGLGYPDKLYMPKFSSKVSDLDPNLEFLTLNPYTKQEVPAVWDLSKNKPQTTQSKRKGQLELPFPDSKSDTDSLEEPAKKDSDKTPPILKNVLPEPKKSSNESVLRKAVRQTALIRKKVINEDQVIRVDLPELPRLNPKVVQVVNPEFSNDGQVIPRPADASPGEKGEPSKVAKGEGISWDQFTNETKKVWKDMYGPGEYPSNTKVGLSEKEPGHKPNTDKSVNKRFFAVISRDGVLYVRDEQDKLWYPSQNDLLYARAVERLYGLEIIDHGDKNIFKGTQNVQTLLKRLWKNKGDNTIVNFVKDQLGIGKGKAKPNDPGSTKSDYFDK